MARGASIAGLGIAFAVAALASAGCGPAEPLRPNLVLITADGVRPDWLVCYGATQALGEEACALGDRGALYEWAIATAASGAPSAASLLTSTYPSQHGVQDEPSTFLPALGPPTLAEVLRAGGYATAGFVGSPELNRSRHLDRGFDAFDDRRPTAGDGSVAAVGLQARAWTATAPEPWFVWIHFEEAHGPFGTDQPARYREAYGDALRRLDRQLSQLVAVLDSRESPPGILFVGLHGQALGERRGALGHGIGLELDQIHVPLVWRSPRIGAGTGVGRRITRVVSTIDVAPTLVEAAGLRAPASFEGLPLPHSETVPARTPARPLFAEHPDAVAVELGHTLAILPRAGPRRPGDPARTRAVQPVRRAIGPAPAAGAASDASSGPGIEETVSQLPTTWRTEAPVSATPDVTPPDDPDVTPP